MVLKNSYYSNFHLLAFSPWPICASVGAFGLTLGGALWWHKVLPGYIISLNMLYLFVVSYSWWSDVSVENSQGFHNKKILTGMRLGMVLFMLSEMLFFFSFFWSFFHNCFSPGSELGFNWPPSNFELILMDPFSIPFLKTVVLLSSGVTMTWCHHGLVKSSKFSGQVGLFVTLMLGVFFLYLQLSEYKESAINMKSSIYGSSFFLLTGFHGLHVTMGSVYLLVSLMRFFTHFYSSESHVSFELCAWYWHFVDVVWLFLYCFVYWYGFLI